MDYILTKHFYERLNERFNVSSSEAERWVKRYFSRATKDHSEDKGRKAIYRMNGIEIVADKKDNKLISVYTCAENKVSKELPGITNPEIKQAITESLKCLKYRVIQRTAKKNTEYLEQIAKLNSDIANSRNFKYLDDKQKDIDRMMISVNLNQAECGEILEEIESIK